MPGRIRKTKKKIRTSRLEGQSTRCQEREMVTEVMENDYCLVPSLIRPSKLEKAYLRKTVQADIDGVVNAMPGNPIDVIIAVSVSGVHSRVSLPS
jgi:hypothetical protein